MIFNNEPKYHFYLVKVEKNKIVYESFRRMCVEDVSEVYSGMDRIDYVRCRIELWYKESLDNQLFL